MVVPCHFKGDPVMPGCLGLDALWRLLRFFLAWLGSSARAGRLDWRTQVFRPGAPSMKNVVYGLEIERVHAFQARSRRRRRLALGDSAVIYKALDLEVGLFRDTTR